MSQSLGQIKRVGISRNWTSFNVRWIDMFCVHYEFWNKGIGSALLNTLYVEHERNGDAACFFMKEGGPLKMPAIRSSSYAFRVIKNFDSLRLSPKIEPWTINNFLNYAQALPEKTNCFIHNNCGDKTKIFCYNGFRGRIIAAFVKGHEHDYEGHYPIIWSSGYLKHDALLDSEVNEAAKLLSEAAALSFNSPYIWMDARHVGKNSMANSDLWSYDGSYHMYAYHMDTGIYFNAEPFLIL